MERILILLMALVMTGCAVGPDYKRPPVSTPLSWMAEEKETKDLINTAWWDQFNDPVLNDLIQSALKENKDVKNK